MESIFFVLFFLYQNKTELNLEQKHFRMEKYANQKKKILNFHIELFSQDTVREILIAIIQLSGQ